ncbi:hypothetical protein A2U01_0070787 [Trifolium medium]|uniref:Uncharacterized protein n=1 Tax=Trifolium medium TaxID=97028 RepID=A0A392SL00_9FABA|nr:hypothetical protein [Trifolium medium]
MTPMNTSIAINRHCCRNEERKMNQRERKSKMKDLGANEETSKIKELSNSKEELLRKRVRKIGIKDGIPPLEA